MNRCENSKVKCVKRAGRECLRLESQCTPRGPVKIGRRVKGKACPTT
jgi:hypothetical protein